MLTKDYTKTNKQWSKHKAVEWLVNNPVTADIDVSFLRRRLKSFIEEANAASTTSSNYWVGSVPFLRLIHCLVDFENIKEAFLKSFESMSRQELDGRFNDNIRRESPWLLIADKWNDSDYNPTSTPYVTLHQDFQTAIDLSFDKVKNMGELTPDSAKARFFKMKNDLLVIKNAWELSGNGDGCIARGADDTLDNANNMINGNIKANFLNGKNVDCLYLWEKADELQLLQSVCQQLSLDSAVDTEVKRVLEQSNDTSNVAIKKPKKSSEEEDKILKDLKASIDLTNDIAKENSEIARENNEIAKETIISRKILGLKEDKRHYESLINMQTDKLYDFEDKLDELPDVTSKKWKRMDERRKKCSELIESYKQSILEIEVEIMQCSPDDCTEFTNTTVMDNDV